MTAFGIRMIESRHATALPTGKPYTDDMRAMVEHFDQLGLIQRRPAAFTANGTLFIHPAIATQLRREISKTHDRMAHDAFFGVR